jgi:CSLREA domain-containing protein
MRARSLFIVSWLTRVALLVVLAASAFPVTPVYAASIVVNSNEDTDSNTINDGKCTLREAIAAANADLPRGGCIAGAGADTISFADNYTITAGSQLPIITTPITIAGRGAGNTIIQAAASPNVATWRILQIVFPANVTLDGVTLQHGRCNGMCSALGNIHTAERWRRHL